jgi:CHRD domain-containing protein
MKKKLFIGPAVVVVVALALTGASAVAGGEDRFSARLGGFQEIPTISTDGHGTFAATLEDDELHFTLSYWGLSGPATQAHIHLGRIATIGGVSAFLCGGSGRACPSGANGKVTVTGVINADDVIGPTAQGIDPGEFEEILAAMGANAAYVNVHTELYPSGEIRGQVRQG